MKTLLLTLMGILSLVCLPIAEHADKLFSSSDSIKIFFIGEDSWLIRYPYRVPPSIISE